MGTFTSGATYRPGAFTLFCCGPQVTESLNHSGRDASDQTNSLIQMQLKTTDTTTGLLEGHQTHNQVQLHDPAQYGGRHGAPVRFRLLSYGHVRQLGTGI